MKKNSGKRRVITKSLAAVGVGALILHGVRAGMQVLGPTRPFYPQPDAHPDAGADDFAPRLACVVDSILYSDTRIAVFKNGGEFYPAELDAIDSAQRSINIEMYEFLPGRIAGEFVAHLARRAREGVQVRVVYDALGSWGTALSFFDPLIEAGGHVCRFHPLDWRDWPYANHRTHRKLLIVDGRIGFIGGAGIADHWIYESGGQPPWRDTMFRVEGGAALSLNATFAQTWADASGEVVLGENEFPIADTPGNQAHTGKTCMVVMSTPRFGSTQARVLLQTLIDAAKSHITITSPYFVPDRSGRDALRRAVRERGIRVQVLTAGRFTDHPSTRRLSEGLSAKLLRDGMELYEYEPGMIHAKLLTIDGVWTVGGSTNFDHRSFSLNKEVNIAICDREITETVESHFREDIERSRAVRKPGGGLSARVLENVSWIFRREE